LTFVIAITVAKPVAALTRTLFRRPIQVHAVFRNCRVIALLADA
jgi:hypothetical protein